MADLEAFDGFSETIQQEYERFLDDEVVPRLKEYFENKDVSEPYIRVAAHSFMVYVVTHVLYSDDKQQVAKKIQRTLEQTAVKTDNSPRGYVYQQSKIIGWLEEAGVAHELVSKFYQQVVPTIREEFEEAAGKQTE